MTDFDFGGPVVWTPDAASAAATHLGRFMTAHRLTGFPELLDRSAADPAWFTQMPDHRFRGSLGAQPDGVFQKKQDRPNAGPTDKVAFGGAARAGSFG